MGAIETARDALFGNPPNPTQEPSREGMLAAITELAQSVANTTLGTMLSATFETLADANLDLAYPADSVALIYNDTANDLAIKSGASGAGTWTLTTILRDAIEFLTGSAIAQAQEWAEGEGEPGEPGSKSSKTWSEEAAEKVVEAQEILDLVEAQTPDTTAPYPVLGLNDYLDPVVQQDTNLLSWTTPDGRERRVRRDAVEGVDFDAAVVPFVEDNGDLTAVIPGAASVTIPAEPNWPNGDTLRFSPAGIVGGVPLVGLSRPGIAIRSAVALGRTGMMALAHDPDLVHILIADGQSLSTGTNGKWFTSSALYATTQAELAARNIWMPMLAGASDIRMGKQADWDAGTGAAIDPDSIVGLMPAGPRLLPNIGWTSAIFGESILERAAKVYSDGVFAATGRRPMILIFTVGFGGISIENLLSTGANMPGGGGVNKRTNDNAVFARIATILEGMNKDGIVVGVLRKHGESSSSTADYKTKAAQHIAETNAGIKAAFGQVFDPVWIEHVTSATANDPTGAVNYHRSTRALAEMHAVDGSLHIAGPDYIFTGRQAFAVTGVPTPPNPDYVHMTARGYALTGESMAKQLLSVYGFNRRHPVLWLSSVTRVSGTVFDLGFSTDDGAATIEIDGSPSFNAPANAGVTYLDTSGGTLPTVSSVAVSSGKVRVTMNTSIDARAGRLFAVAENGPASGVAHSATAKGRSTIRVDGDPIYTSEVDATAVHAYSIPSALAF